MSETSGNGTVYQFTGAQGAPVMVLIHGLGLNRGIWDAFASAFSNRYRVLRYDLFGHGESAVPPSMPTLTVFSEQLLGLMDELEIEQAILIGFSLGGMINRRLAMDHPQRVSALAILNSPHEREPAAQKLVEQRALDSASGGPGATLDATLERWFTAGFRLGPGLLVLSSSPGPASHFRVGSMLPYRVRVEFLLDEPSWLIGRNDRGIDRVMMGWGMSPWDVGGALRPLDA